MRGLFNIICGLGGLNNPHKYGTPLDTIAVQAARVRRSSVCTSLSKSPADNRTDPTYCTVSCTTAKLVRWLQAHVSEPSLSDNVLQPRLSQLLAV